jgi:hypothetical protein
MAVNILPSAALAASYTDSFVVDPTTLACGYYVTGEVCNGYSMLSPSRTLNAGDELTETVNYTSPATVPGSARQNTFYIGLFNSVAANGAAPPGPDVATVVSSIEGYSGPPNPIVGPYTAGYLNQYVAGVGFCCGFGVPNPGFSLTGMQSHFTIVQGDPHPNVGVDFGYGVVLPYTPLVASETGGSVDHPAILPAGLVGRITSNISGGTGPDTQFYVFDWLGGLFQTTGAVAGANPLADFHFQLYSIGGSAPLDDILLQDSNSFTGLMSLDLAPGYYEVGMYTNSPFDPPFTITFNTPVGFIPEPSTWSLMLLGFAALGGSLRRRRPTLAP